MEPDKNQERVSLRTQLILAAIPSFISQIIAFYRIKKLAQGIVIEVAIFFIDLAISSIISWPVSTMIALPITVVIPVYYIRKWTLEFNTKPTGLF